MKFKVGDKVISNADGIGTVVSNTADNRYEFSADQYVIQPIIVFFDYARCDLNYTEDGYYMERPNRDEDIRLLTPLEQALL